MQHPKLTKWEGKLEKVLDELDDMLEDKYGSLYRLHPARAPRGKTSKKSHDGLFDVTAGFSLGIGSKLGRGYVIELHFATLEKVNPKMREQIENEAIELLDKLLLKYFPDTNLEVVRDKHLIKIFGDLSLGQV